jgi:hypothetical protein
VQFTGLKAKNQRDIREGDIIRFWRQMLSREAGKRIKREFVCVVKWCDDDAGYWLHFLPRPDEKKQNRGLFHWLLFE